VHITHIKAETIPTSREHATTQCSLLLSSGHIIQASVPQGISTSKYEAATQTITHTLEEHNNFLFSLFIGRPPNLGSCDKKLKKLYSKGLVAKEAALSLSIAMARAEAYHKKLSLADFLQTKLHFLKRPYSTRFLFNLIQGGAHSSNDLSFQEIMVMPLGDDPLTQGLLLQEKTIAILEQHGYASTSCNIPCWPTGNEGKKLSDEFVALDICMEAIRALGLIPGTDVSIAIDVAASQLYNPITKLYRLQKKDYSTDELVVFYQKLVGRYPITFLEDPFDADDLDGWKQLTHVLGENVQIVGEDLFASDKDRITLGIEQGLANGAIIKPGQTITVSDLLASITLCQKNNLAITTSPRSCETTDTFVADLTYAAQAIQFKTIACRCDFHARKSERLVQLLSDTSS